MKVTKLRELASSVCANADHYSVLAMDLAFEALEVANRIEFSSTVDQNRINSSKWILLRALADRNPGSEGLDLESVVCLAADELERLYSADADFSKEEIADAEKIASDIRNGKVETFSLQEVASKMGIELNNSALLEPEDIIIRAFAHRPNPHRPKGSGSIRKKNGGFYAKTSADVPVGKFETREGAESALRGALDNTTTGLFGRKRRVGSVVFRKNRHEARFKGKYVGRYETKEEAEAALCRINSALRKLEQGSHE